MIEKFKEYFPKYYDDMKNIEHGWNGNPNPWHLEGSIKKHTEMVIKECETRYSFLGDHDFKILYWACLFHDVGKTICFRDDETKERRYFHGHWNFSYYMVLDLINNKEFKEDIGFNNDDIYLIADACLNHHVRYEGKEIFINDSRLINFINMLSECDSNGRISADKSDDKSANEMLKMGDYKKKDKKKPTITFLIGPPCAGKSSYIRYGKYENILSSDDIVMDLGKSDDYNENFRDVKREDVENELMKRYNSFIDAGEDFIIDMTNMVKKRRKRFHNKEFNSKAVLFRAGYKELFERNKLRKEKENKFIPEHVIDSMIKSLTMKYLDEFNIVETTRA